MRHLSKLFPVLLPIDELRINVPSDGLPVQKCGYVYALHIIPVFHEQPVQLLNYLAKFHAAGFIFLKKTFQIDAWPAVFIPCPDSDPCHPHIIVFDHILFQDM